MFTSDEGDDDSDREAKPTTPKVKPPLKVLHLLKEDLHFCDDWHDMVSQDNGRPPKMWGATFLSKKVLLARNELLTLLRTKLRMTQTWTNTVLLAKTVHLKCFGSAMLLADNYKRKVVDTSSTSPDRRDFVRLKGTVDNTALSVQVMCFVQVSGLKSANIPVPEDLLKPPTNACNSDRIVFALGRGACGTCEALLDCTRFMQISPGHTLVAPWTSCFSVPVICRPVCSRTSHLNTIIIINNKARQISKRKEKKTK